MFKFNEDSFLISYVLFNCSSKLNLLQVRRNKIVLYVSPNQLRFVLQFLSKSMFIKANNLLDLELLIILIEIIDLRLVICVFIKV